MNGERPSQESHALHASRANAVLLRVLIALFIATAATGAVTGGLMILTDADDDLIARGLGIPAAIAGCLLLWIVDVAVLVRDRRPHMQIALALGMTIALAAAGVWTVLIIWEGALTHRQEEFLAQIGGSASAVATALALSGAMAQARSYRGLVRSMAIATRISAWIAACLITLLCFFAEQLDDAPNFETLIMLLIITAACVILSAVGTVTVPIAIVTGAGKRREPVESIDPRVQIHFGCPKCGEKQTHRPGFVRCSKCGTGMFIEVEEPRCECGYLLYQLTGETCPECGRPVIAPVGG